MAIRLEQLQQQMKINADILQGINCPKQTLSAYRARSIISQQEWKEVFIGQKWKYQEDMYEIVKKNRDQLRHHHLDESDRDEQRYRSFKALIIFFNEMTKLNITYDEYIKDPNIVTAALAGMYAFDPAVSVKFAVHFALYTKTIQNLGTDKHKTRFENAKKLQDIGSFALTEVGHGSNVRSIMTTAIFDQQKQCFILNTPHQLATKFWIGATANIANMTVVFAQLYIHSQNHGVHAFLVEIRDKSTHDLKDGVIVGDCGPKNGLNGIDNGFLIFNNLPVPLDNLLDRFSQVSKDGVFTTIIEDPDKRFATQLGSLSGGRIALSLYTNVNSISALTIAFRYAAVRQQFGKPDENESSILEYPLTQYRLVPKLATTLVYLNAAQQLQILWNATQAVVFEPNDKRLMEVHAISSILKGMMSSFTSDVILECRQILGGHGFHQFNRLGTLFNDHDINTTWEGDQNVLLQQTAKLLLDSLQKLSQSKKLKHETLQFMTISPANKNKSPFDKSNESLLNDSNLLHALEHRANSYIQVSGLKFKKNISKTGEMMDAWNSTLAQYLKPAALAYGDVYCCQEWLKMICKIKDENNLKVMNKCFQLWVLTILDKDIGLYLQTNYLQNYHSGMIKDLIEELCLELKDQAIGILDVLAPPDEVLGSAFGSYDGNIYEKYFSMIYSAKNTFRKVSWWNEIYK